MALSSLARLRLLDVLQYACVAELLAA